MPMFIEFSPISVTYCKVILEILFKPSFIKMPLINSIYLRPGGLKILQK